MRHRPSSLRMPSLRMLRGRAGRAGRLSRAVLGVAVAAVCAAPGLAAQAGGAEAVDVEALRPGAPVPITRISETIEVDGVVNEPVWDTIDPVPLFIMSPVHGGEQTERTEIRLAHDDRYLYVSGRMYDSNPDGIRVNTFYRDIYSGDDLLSFVVDSYNDYETALWFGANPAGVRYDRSVSNDAEFTGDLPPFNQDWNAHWDVITMRNGEGWFAEFRIPFSTLGFQAQGDEVTMGITIYRYISRKNERQVYPPIGREWGRLAFMKPSQTQRMTLREVRPTSPVHVTPYVLGGLSQTPVLREPADAAAFWATERDRTAEPGVDLKYSPSSNLAIDVTVNTDFAQVEADDQQINLTRFSLFFPEKRQFFQERSSTFDFGTGGFTDRVFFSRRVGLEGGELVRIYGGARVVGRLGGLDYGLLNMQTAPAAGRSGENVGVMRVKQQVFNPFSFVGGILATRIGANGQDNVAYGVDAQIRPLGNEWVTLTWAQTFDEAVNERNPLDAGLFRARWERRTDRGLSYNLYYRRVGPDYTPRLGFQLRRDFTLFGGEVGHTWLQGPSASLNTVTLSVMGENYYRNADITPESRSIRPEVEFAFKSGSSIAVYSNTQFEDIRIPFRITGLSIPTGEYWFQEAGIDWMLPRAAIFRGDIRASVGSFYDGRRVGLIFNPTWSASRYLEIGGGYEINRIEFPDRGEARTTQLGRVKLSFALNRSISLSTFAQYNNLDKQTSINARFRYHFREGTDLWIVYNEGLNFERDRGFDPRLPWSAGRNVMIKYSHTFSW